LPEAEQLHTSAKQARTALAKDFGEGCLQPARSPYEAQCLPEADPVRERKRCEAVQDRVAQLRKIAS